MDSDKESDIDWQLENETEEVSVQYSLCESDAIEHMVLECKDILFRLPFLCLISHPVLEMCQEVMNSYL